MFLISLCFTGHPTSSGHTLSTANLKISAWMPKVARPLAWAQATRPLVQAKGPSRTRPTLEIKLCLEQLQASQLQILTSFLVGDDPYTTLLYFYYFVIILVWILVKMTMSFSPQTILLTVRLRVRVRYALVMFSFRGVEVQNCVGIQVSARALCKDM